MVVVVIEEAGAEAGPGATTKPHSTKCRSPWHRSDRHSANSLACLRAVAVVVVVMVVVGKEDVVVLVGRPRFGRDAGGGDDGGGVDRSGQ